jgi:subtilase family serine protease
MVMRLPAAHLLAGMLMLAALGSRPIPAEAQAPQLLAPAGAAEAATFDIYFPLRDPDGAEQLIYEQVRKGSPQYHKWLTPQQFVQRFGPTPQTVAAVSAELARFGMPRVIQKGQQLRVPATVAAVEAAFGVRLWHGRFADGTAALVADRPLSLPAVLAGLDAVIPQFTTVPPAHKHSRMLPTTAPNFSSPLGPYYTADLREAYDYPAVTAADGSGAVIGILMDNDILTSDIADYFETIVASGFEPRLSEVKVDGGAPFNVNDSGEVTLDIQQSTGMALNANAILYNLPSLSPSAILAGLTDIDNDNEVDVVNMSFGTFELKTTKAIVKAEDAAFAQGSAQGITFVASSGDHGAAQDPGDSSTISPQSPADDPYVTGVGGTNLVTSFTKGSNDSSYVGENADPDQMTNSGCQGDSLPAGCIWGSGGGASIYFKKPKYQKLVPTGTKKARVVPDVAGHMGGCFPDDSGFVQPCGADRSHDYEIIGGNQIQVIGTSASSPDFVGLVAIFITLEQSRLGALNPFIYQQAKTQIEGGAPAFFHSAISGNNGIYQVQAPYDPVIGNGTVDGRQLFGLTNLPPAGTPDTAANP